MQVLPDFQGPSVRLTDERLAHILGHAEMAGMEAVIGETLLRPQRVVQSVSDPLARQYYRFYFATMVGNKYVCVVVKLTGADAFVLAAYSHEQNQARSTTMAERHVKVWYDAEGDFLEVIFDQKPGYYRETPNDAVMEKVDADGNVIGFSLLGVSAAKQKPLEVALAG